MNISSISLINNFYKNGINKNFNVPRFNTPLSADTVSFGYLHEDVDQNLQVYRSISESEFKNLLKGDTFYHKYVTSDPRGWDAGSWDSGYVHPNTKEPVYFITFKTNVLKITSRRDDEDDTRYGVYKYTINDVKDVRKGTNAHGEIVYAENLQEAKAVDKKEKEKRISELETIIESSTNQDEKAEAWDELSSFASEYPSIVERMQKYVDYENEFDINNYAYLIQQSDKEEFKGEYNKCINTLLRKGMKIESWILHFYDKHAQLEDLDTLFQILESKKKKRYKYSHILSGLIENKEAQKIIFEKYKQHTNEDILVLVNCLQKRNEDGRYTDVFRDILNHHVDVKTRSDELEDDENEDEDEYFIYSVILDKCSAELGKFGNKEDIKLLEKFIDKERPDSYPSIDIMYAIENIMSR